MSLSEDVKNYKNLQLAFHTKVPQKIIDRWRNYIIPKNFSSLGEKGVDVFIGGRKYGEKTLVYHAFQADVERCLEMADGFWKKAYAVSLEKPESKIQKTNKSTAFKQSIETKTVKIISKDKSVLREWWHSILYTYGKNSCYAIILALPTDVHVIKYLTESEELDLLSGEYCPVIALSDKQAIRYGSGEDEKRLAIKEQIANGQSIEIANLFEIKFTEFPCMVIFQDVRSPDYFVVPLQKMEIDEISQKMRSVFSTIQSTSANKVNPLIELKAQQMREGLQRAGQSAFGELRKLTKNTIQMVMEAYIQSEINPASRP